jgi:hypothetical protein
MNEDVCSSIFPDLNTVTDELGDAERFLFIDISTCHALEREQAQVHDQAGGWGRRIGAGKPKRDVPRSRLSKESGTGTVFCLRTNTILFHHQPLSLHLVTFTAIN